MKGHRSRLLGQVAAALLAISVLSGPATAQGGLDTRLAEAEQKLDSDIKTCQPVNLAEYANLLSEAMANKQRAIKAAKKGVPINQAQVDADLGKASLLFARAQAAQAMQCVLAAQAAQHAMVTREQLEGLPVGHRPADLVASCPPDTFPTITTPPGAVAGGVAASLPVSLTCAAPADRGMVEVYRTHNQLRSEYGAPPLVRDPALEVGAAEYVGELVRVGRPVHASRAGRGNIRENISQGLSWWSPAQLLAQWTRERANFVPGTFPNVSRTHNWYDVGHIAQMLWIRTVLIGCARAAGISGAFMVCRYGPGGNRDGEQVGIPPRQYSVVAPTLPTAEVYGPRSGSTSPSTSTSTPTSTSNPTSGSTQPPASDSHISYPGTFVTDDFKEMGERWNAAVDRYDKARKACDAQTLEAARKELAELGPKLQQITEASKEAGPFSKYGTAWADVNIAVIDAKLEEIGVKKKSPSQQVAPKPPAPTSLPPPADTKVQPPTLPTHEVYNPADRPQCALEIM